MHVSIHVCCVRKILLAPFCAALHMDDFCLFCLVVVHKAWTTSTLLPRCAPIDWHVSMKHGLLLNTSIAKLSICIWTTKAFCPSYMGKSYANGKSRVVNREVGGEYLIKRYELKGSISYIIYSSDFIFFILYI